MSEDANDALTAPSRLADMLAMLTHPFSNRSRSHRVRSGLVVYSTVDCCAGLFPSVGGFTDAYRVGNLRMVNRQEFAGNSLPAMV